MPAMRFCFVLFLSLCFVLYASGIDRCAHSKENMTDVRKCAVRELLWGWLNVTNKTAVRAEKVMDNATALRDRANTVETKAKESLKMAQDVMERLKNSDSKQVPVVEKAVKVLKDVIARVNTSREEAVKAEKSANNSTKAAVNGYGVILRAAKTVSQNDQGTEVSHEMTLKKIDMITVGAGGCHDELFVSKNLSDIADKLDLMENLSEWKKQTLRLLNSTYAKITENNTTCHSTFNNDGVKFQGVKDAISSAAEGLGNALKEFDTANLVLKEAEQIVTNATREVEVVNATMLGRFKKNGEALCGMIGRHAELSTQLRATVEHLGGTKQQVTRKVSDTEDLLANATETNKVVQTVVGAISRLLKAGSLSLSPSGSLFASQNITSANESVKRLKYTASVLAQNAASVGGSTNEVESHTKNSKEVLEHISKQLIARLNETQLNINSLSADECNKTFFEVVDKSWGVAFERALLVNESALMETESAIKKLETQIRLMETNLSKINNSVLTITEKMRAAVQFEEKAKTAAADAVADVLRSLMEEVCASATELHKLHMDTDGFKGRAVTLRTNVSEESRRAEGAWRNATANSEMPQDVEDGFTHASRGVVVLEKQLQRIDAQYARVTTGLSEGLKIAKGGDAKIYIPVVNFLRDINSNLTALSLPSVCSGDRITELVQSLMEDRDTMLSSSSVIVALGELAVKVRERVTAARDQMKKVVLSAADAQAAVEEAIRRARDANAGRRCTPLHRQLLNLLQHIW
ncbi:hypothetical protein, conserved in T. vivax [Trypanosoma vivax Y486]|uniref:Uncharacterized protein n=1 Tax=Trypanosoma vivax (strain Y486) TaxID=1055687 RepID=F9WV72_TRYVY|nr:hypothetical protein, conserved in T. vivax [Trypanosoma vivax Y486]|eukprot:CCD21478.1 hypothetical protein, conserved in T. vivax [Trypanosoma vivax Y486]